MAQKKTIKQKQSTVPKKVALKKKDSVLPWVLLICGITAVCLWPMLNNEFTNWDDEFYVINNKLLRGPDWQGIFTEPVVGNYHPFTVMTLAFNYAISATDPFSYLLVNYLLHLINTALVFYFIWNISNKQIFVAAFVALVFGVHPMHVESVAWVSERKDVLYTLFFILSLMQYWRFLNTNKKSHFWLCFLFFVLSLLSKPAAVILPLVLLLLDYWKGRSINLKAVTEKIPFFILAIIIGIVTIKIQSPTAMAGLSTYSVVDRMFFACYTLMVYFLRFFIPYPLSAFHPFPPTGSSLGWPILISPLFVVGLLLALWFLRKSKIVVFGLLFYVINLLLVLQVISIGLTIVSERYTYVPYIGLAFTVGMALSNTKYLPQRSSWAIASVFIVIMGIITFNRADVWQNSNTLWTDVIETFPRTPYPRSNRANYLSILASKQANKKTADSLNRLALEDCNVAIEVQPNHAAGFEKRSLIYLGLGMPDSALADADALVKYAPNNKIGYDVRGTVYFGRKEPQKAMENYNKCIEINPEDHRSYSNRGTIYMNFYQQYPQALNEFNKAISISPLGSYLLNRSICYYRMGDMAKAREDALAAAQKGTVLQDSYKSLLQLK